MMQRFDECKEVVSAVVMYRKASGNSLSLHVFGDLLKQLANVSGDAAVKEINLMMAPPCEVQYNDATKTVVAVSRWTERFIRN